MTLTEEIDELARRLERAGWVFDYEEFRRPDDLREHDEQAVSKAEELLGMPLPPFLRQFVLDVGVVFFLGQAAEDSTLAGAVPAMMGAEGAAQYEPLTTIPLPMGLDELYMSIREFDEAALPIVHDALTAIGVSGGPPLCIIFDADEPQATRLFVDCDPDAPLGLDLESYVRRCLSQGGFFHLPEGDAADVFRELGAGLGNF